MVTVVLAGSAITGAAITVDSLMADPQAAQTLWLLEQSFFDVLIAPPLIVFTLGVSILSIKHGDPPRWLGWSGIAVIVGLIVNYPFALGSLAALGFFWVLALAVTVTIRSQPQQNNHVQQQPKSTS